MTVLSLPAVKGGRGPRSAPWRKLSNTQAFESPLTRSVQTLALPGVVAVLTGADVPGHGRIGPVKADEPLFPEEVQFYGQPVAWVLADTLHEARRGAAAVVAEYEPLPAVLSIRDAIAAGSFLTDDLRIATGTAPAAAPASPQGRGVLC